MIAVHAVTAQWSKGGFYLRRVLAFTGKDAGNKANTSNGGSLAHSFGGEEESGGKDEGKVVRVHLVLLVGSNKGEQLEEVL